MSKFKLNFLKVEVDFHGDGYINTYYLKVFSFNEKNNQQEVNLIDYITEALDIFKRFHLEPSTYTITYFVGMQKRLDSGYAENSFLKKINFFSKERLLANNDEEYLLEHIINAIRDCYIQAALLYNPAKKIYLNFALQKALIQNESRRLNLKISLDFVKEV